MIVRCVELFATDGLHELPQGGACLAGIASRKLRGAPRSGRFFYVRRRRIDPVARPAERITRQRDEPAFLRHPIALPIDFDAEAPQPAQRGSDMLAVRALGMRGAER